MQKQSALKPYPLFRLTIPLVAGIFLCDTFGRNALSVDGWAIAVCLLFVGMAVASRRQKYTSRWLFGGTAFLFLFCLGALLVQRQWKQVSYDWPLEKNVYQGVIVETPQEKAKTYLCKMRVDTRVSVGKVVPVHRTLLLYVMKDSLSEQLRCGDWLQFYVRVTPSERMESLDTFDYGTYLSRKQISGTAVAFSGYWRRTGEYGPLTFRQQAGVWRDRILDCYRRWGFSGDEYAVLSALTVGYREELSDELQDTYRMAGVSHILALSGMHVAILWGMLAWLLGPLDRLRSLKWLRCFLITLLLWAFAFLVGLSPSVVRAVVMCMLMTMAYTAGGRSLSLNTLAVAAFFMLLYNPFYLFDAGFQLSFLAVLSIILVYPPLFGCMEVHHPLLRYVWGVMEVSLAAQVGTFPLVVYYFSFFPVHFLLSNLIVAPLACLILYGTVAMFVFSPVVVLHEWVVKALDGLLWCLNHSMQWVEGLPMARSGNVHFSVAETCLLYLLLFMMAGYWYRRSHKWLVCILLVANVFVGVEVYQTHFQKEVPQLLLSRAQVKNYSHAKMWQRDSIYYCKGVTVCLIADDRWQNKKADKLLDVDYVYVCRGYRGKIVSLQKLFRIRKIVLDSSLSDYKANSLKEECGLLGLDYIDMSGKGFLRISL